MRQMFVTPKNTFKYEDVVLQSEADGGGPILGLVNDKEGTVDFPPGRLKDGKSYSIPQDKFIETDELNTLRKKVSDFESPNKSK